MTGTDKLQDLLKSSRGVVTAKLADAHGIHREYLSEFVRQGKLERISHGIYIAPEVWEDKMLLHQLRKSKMVYSHETALYLHDLTDRDPVAYCVTVPAGYNTSRLNQDGLIVHTVKKELIGLGVCTKQTSFGNDIRVYDMERTICDILRDRNKQDAAVLSDALKRYVRRKDKDLNKAMKYAGILRVEKILRNYLEVLL
ncbi:type IV toxin-antitoxin system AbiEi family antitoxin domain-containing protein [Desulfoscipio sp. XC116]|uniref:type IV toxin-antitoxin system AbiEi family antitoxin domain-containing protein n=1 Tax=Desulfoscipio sp. XC116 TaxID=3144975 RepID=UPI00325B9ED6